MKLWNNEMTREGSSSRVKNLQSSYFAGSKSRSQEPPTAHTGRLGRNNRPPGLSVRALKSFSITCKYFLPISRRAEGGEDGGDFRRQEGAAGETGQMRGGGVVDEQRLELLPGRAGSNGREIGLRQLHSSVWSCGCFHTAKILKISELCKYFSRKSGHKLH